MRRPPRRERWSDIPLVGGDHFVYRIGREQPLLEQDGLQRPGACFHVREWSWMMTVFSAHRLMTSS